MSTETTLGERYPEHAKLEKVKGKSQAIYDFLQFAKERGIDFGRTVVTRVAVFEGTEDCTAVQPVEGEPFKQLLAQFFGLDLAKINAEQEQMIADLAALNAPKES